jgi:16S rRNA A1518/A1519 N6-dimethyltransferase RsmA/KsgA/DIM1 with predicted DNA glycosylase/AP lyase activity
VRSAVVRITPHATPPFVVDDRVWRAVVDGTFRVRRKKLRNSLPAAVAGIGIRADAAARALAGLGIADARPETLSPAAFAALCHALGTAQSGGG